VCRIQTKLSDSHSFQIIKAYEIEESENISGLAKAIANTSAHFALDSEQKLPGKYVRNNRKKRNNATIRKGRHASTLINIIPLALSNKLLYK
jgi:hypothetical protein